MGDEAGEARLLSRPASLARTFNRAAAAYDGRPGYPAQVYDVLVRHCGLGPGTKVVEIGPGVGQATATLVDLGAHVVAVEPGEALAGRLRERVPSANLDIHVAGFEDVALPDASADMVCAATSFHWVQPRTGIAKAARVLRDGGWLALWWTVWGGDPYRPDVFREALMPILQRKAPELTKEEHGPGAYCRDVAARVALIAEDGSFEPVKEFRIEWEVTHDSRSLRRLFETLAGWIALPDDVRNDVLDDVESLVREDFGGTVTRPYLTLLYLARRRPR